MHTKVSIVSKFKSNDYISSTQTRKEALITFLFNESIFVPSGSIIKIEIPEYNYYYKSDEITNSIFIDEIKFYSDVSIIDFPSKVEFNRSKWL